MNSYAVAVTAVGVNTLNWNIINFGIALDSTVAPVIAVTMMSRGGKYRDPGLDLIHDYNGRVASNYSPSAPMLPPGTPKWIALAITIALLTQVDGCVDGAIDFFDWVMDRNDDEETSIGPSR